MKNKCILVGNIVEKIRPCMNQETGEQLTLAGEKMYETKLDVARLSGVKDEICLVIPEDKLPEFSEKRVRVTGRFCSRNETVDGHRRLILYVYVTRITEADAEQEDINILYLNGYMCKDPVYRETPKRRKITDLLLANNQTFSKGDSAAYYIPAICWGRNAEESSKFSKRDFVRITGRIQSRIYAKGENKYTVYEVSVSKIHERKAPMKRQENNN